MERSQNDLTLKPGATCPPPFFLCESLSNSAFALRTATLHTIRLRGPWQSQSLAGGMLRFERRFHQPTGLDAASRVWLAIAEADSQARIELNGQFLGEVDSGSHAPARFEITSLVKPQNLLSVSVTSPRPDESTSTQPPQAPAEQPAGLIGQVSLEIE